MNLGLITSYIIAGMILIAMLMMNISLSRSSSELTFTEIKREHLQAVQETFTSDINKMGYNTYNKLDPIFATADSNEISFYSNIDNSADQSVEQITWELLTGTPDESSDNPNDYVLRRTVDGVANDIKMGVTRFRIRYYSTYGASESNAMTTPVSAADFEDIRQIQIILELQSPEQITVNTSGGGYYVRTVWEKRFSPANLEQDF